MVRHVEAVGISRHDRRVTSKNKEGAEGANLIEWPQEMSIAIVEVVPRAPVPAAVTNERAVDSVEKKAGETESEESLEKAGSTKAGSTKAGRTMVGQSEGGDEVSGQLRRWQAVAERPVQATSAT